MWGYVEKSGAWIKVDEKIKTLLQENKIEVKDSYQGIKSVYEFLEADEKITSLLVDFIKENILKQ